MRIYARKTTVRSIDQAEANSFVELHHRSGSVSPRSKVVSLGLFNAEELVGVAQFCSPRTARVKREYSVELLRLAFPNEIRVVGGASKLLSHFKLHYSPADVFTYQDTTGETTDVYEHAGFTLVRQASKKEYLVAPGKELGTAKRGEYYSMAQVVTMGPDALLGTTLGEVLTDAGERKTNPQLFIEELGWHLETTSGDRVYEWIDQNRTYYTYRISASDSDKYYYGVSHVKLGAASFADCATDGYFGSGGKHARNKFTNWKVKHRSTIQKEVLATYSRQAEAYEAEKKLIGELYRTDPNCLNSTTGGKDGGLNFRPADLRESNCEVHGLATHRNGACLRCEQAKSREIKPCPKHGDSLFLGNSCYKCASEGSFKNKTCAVHGNTTFSGDSCKRCAAAKSFSVQSCDIHGETKHRGDNCTVCLADKAVSSMVCETHGETKHIGDMCYRCIRGRTQTEGTCAIHGSVKLWGGSCLRCSLKQAQSLKVCAIHGQTVHRGNHCFKCGTEKAFTRKLCPTHGEVSFRGDTCSKCLGNSLIAEEVCPTHGLTAHKKGKCMKCVMGKATIMKECPTHGLTKHRGDSCFKCRGAKMIHSRSHKTTSVPGCRFCEAS